MSVMIDSKRGLLVALVILLGLWGMTAAEAEARNGKKQYLPALVGGKQPTCDLPNTNYHSLTVAGPSLQVDPDRDENLNLSYRGYEKNSAPRKLVVLGAVFDTKAPQFSGLFADRRTPAFTNTYQRYRWDEGCNCRLDTYSTWEATVLGMGVKPGETIYTPDSGYDIGGGYEYLVMYAGASDITLHVGREDDFPGYVIHIDGVCVDPDLTALYRQLHAAGRDELPALHGHQPFGRALGAEIQIAVRDTGSFMDPRSRNDWWQGR